MKSPMSPLMQRALLSVFEGMNWAGEKMNVATVVVRYSLLSGESFFQKMESLQALLQEFSKMTIELNPQPGFGLPPIIILDSGDVVFPVRFDYDTVKAIETKMFPPMMG